MCIIAKTGSIRDNLTHVYDEPVIYDFGLFQLVLNIGLNTEEFFDVADMDFEGSLNKLEKYYV